MTTSTSRTEEGGGSGRGLTNLATDSTLKIGLAIACVGFVVSIGVLVSGVSTIVQSDTRSASVARYLAAMDNYDRLVFPAVVQTWINHTSFVSTDECNCSRYEDYFLNFANASVFLSSSSTSASHSSYELSSALPPCCWTRSRVNVNHVPCNNVETPNSILGSLEGIPSSRQAPLSFTAYPSVPLSIPPSAAMTRKLTFEVLLPNLLYSSTSSSWLPSNGVNVTVPLTRIFSDSISCSDLPSSATTCTFHQLDTLCGSLHVGGRFSAGGSCSSASLCGTCVYVKVATSWTVVVDPVFDTPPPPPPASASSSSKFIGWTLSSQYLSSTYPFTEASQAYASEPFSALKALNVTIMTSSDPRIVIQEVTTGTNDFGKDLSSVFRRGWLLLSIGAIGGGISLVVAIVLGILYATNPTTCETTTTKTFSPRTAAAAAEGGENVSREDAAAAVGDSGFFMSSEHFDVVPVATMDGIPTSRSTFQGSLAEGPGSSMPSNSGTGGTGGSNNIAVLYGDGDIVAAAAAPPISRSSSSSTRKVFGPEQQQQSQRHHHNHHHRQREDNADDEVELLVRTTTQEENTDLDGGIAYSDEVRNPLTITPTTMAVTVSTTS